MRMDLPLGDQFDCVHWSVIVAVAIRPSLQQGLSSMHVHVRQRPGGSHGRGRFPLRVHAKFAFVEPRPRRHTCMHFHRRQAWLMRHGLMLRGRVFSVGFNVVCFAFSGTALFGDVVSCSRCRLVFLSLVPVCCWTCSSFSV